MTHSVWLKADDAVGDWEARKRRITAGLEAGVDWVLVDQRDVDRVRELGSVNVAAFAGDDVHVMNADPDAVIVGKGGEGGGCHRILLPRNNRAPRVVPQPDYETAAFSSTDRFRMHC